MLRPDLTFETQLWSKGYKFIVGIDEVGRGSWAGPLVAAGVVLPSNFTIPNNFGDSKQVNKNQRQDFSELIKKIAIGYKIVEISPDKINTVGISTATQIAFRKIVKSLNPQPDFILIDAFHIKYMPKGKQNAIKHGDQVSASIAAASIIAKVYRDNLMVEEAKNYPYYGFEKHKGYGTPTHQAAIQKFGLCDIHRNYDLSFLFS